MPNCFVLRDKETKDAIKFSVIDDEMRQAFGEPPDEKKYLYSWYDIVGLALALGKNWQDLREKICYDDPNMLKVIDYLEERYVSEAWYQAR